MNLSKPSFHRKIIHKWPTFHISVELYISSLLIWLINGTDTFICTSNCDVLLFFDVFVFKKTLNCLCLLFILMDSCCCCVFFFVLFGVTDGILFTLQHTLQEVGAKVLCVNVPLQSLSYYIHYFFTAFLLCLALCTQSHFTLLLCAITLKLIV